MSLPERNNSYNFNAFLDRSKKADYCGDDIVFGITHAV